MMSNSGLRLKVHIVDFFRENPEFIGSLSPRPGDKPTYSIYNQNGNEARLTQNCEGKWQLDLYTKGESASSNSYDSFEDALRAVKALFGESLEATFNETTSSLTKDDKTDHDDTDPSGDISPSAWGITE